MNQLNPQEIERRLREQPAAPPPPELLESLEAEIPEPGEIWDEPDRPAASTTWRWLVAASLVVAVGGGLLGYRTLREVNPPSRVTGVTEQQVTTPTQRLSGEELQDLQDLGYLDAGRSVPSEGIVDVPPPESLDEDIVFSGPKTEEIAGPPTAVAEERARATSIKLRESRPRRDQPEASDQIWSDGYISTDAPAHAASEPAAPGPSVSVRQEKIKAELSSGITPPPPPFPEQEAGGARPQRPVMPKPRAKRVAIPQEAPVSAQQRVPPSTGGTHEPNDEPYGDVFYREYGVNPFIDSEDDALSTFGLDVDTGTYTIVRRYLEDGNLPPREAIRVEEMINYFDYGDAPPRRGDFAVHAELAPTPFTTNDRYRLLRFGIRGREISEANRKPATLIFVVDVSGSMDRGNRLGLVKESLDLLLGQLRDDDLIGLVVYGSHGEILLDPTSNRANIRRAIDRLRAGGSTNAEEGLTLAYELASRHFREGAINRILLCSDGVANVGATGPESILARVRSEAERGIELTTVGFGMGNYNDVLMEQLANQGDGSYAYVDELEEARRIFVEKLTGTLQTIAADAKVQVEFNPEVVSRYRLLGYENRDIADERFRDDTVDAGEIGAGHSVTALYEVKLADERPRRAPLATLHLRYRSKETGRVIETEHPVRERDSVERWQNAPAGLKLAATVAELGELLKGSYWAKDGSFHDLLAVAQEISPELAGNEQAAELVGLIARAARLAEQSGREKS